MARTIRRVAAQVKAAAPDLREIWRRIRVVMTRALMPHPEARDAVMRAWEKEFAGETG